VILSIFSFSFRQSALLLSFSLKTLSLDSRLSKVLDSCIHSYHQMKNSSTVDCCFSGAFGSGGFFVFFGRVGFVSSSGVFQFSDSSNVPANNS